VLLIEQRVIGGTCVNVGCVPKKVMFNLAMFLEDSSFMARYGLGGVDGLKLDFKAFKLARDNYVKRLNGIYQRNVANSGITYVEGMAGFSANNKVKVGDKEYSGDHILIACGGIPQPVSFPGAEHCIDSNGFFEMEELPKRIVVIGGGYIGVELAQILNGLGVKTTLVVRSIPLRFVDSEVIDLLIDEIKKSGIDLLMHTSHEGVKKTDAGNLSVSLKNEERGAFEVEADKVLVAIGRPPNTEPLCLQNTDIKLEEKGGFIKVDDYQKDSSTGRRL
jgi:glutathione reductase (NADPH)